MDEQSPYVSRANAQNHYSWSKAEAEQCILAAAGPQFATCSVRPCSGIIGHNDKLILQKSLDDGIAAVLAPQAVIDFVYVDNVVWGHLLAERALREGVSGVSGQAFCISNEEPVSFEDLYLMVKSFQPSLRLVYPPLWLISKLARAVSFVHSTFQGGVSLGKDLNLLTPAAMSTLCGSYTFRIDKARRVLGYEPLFSLKEAVQLMVENHKKSK